MSWMKKTSIFPVLILFVCMLVCGCKGSTSTSGGLSFQQAVLAKMAKSGKLTRVDNGKFERGDSIYLVLFNVGEFKQGEDGLNWFDVDAKVTDPSGKVILLKKEMLGEHGHIKLQNNTLKSPHIYFKTSTALPPGKYSIYMTIYDKLGKGRVSVSRTFELR
jgi:hypothetical protein